MAGSVRFFKVYKPVAVQRATMFMFVLLRMGFFFARGKRRELAGRRERARKTAIDGERERERDLRKKLFLSLVYTK